jgi:hypothetical protein
MSLTLEHEGGEVLGVDAQDHLAILLIPFACIVEYEEMLHVRKRVINLKVVDKCLAFGWLQEADVKIKLSRPPPRRVSRVFE